MMKTLGWILIPLVLVALLIGYLGLDRRSSSDNRVADLPAVIRQIQQLSELVSVKYTIQKVVGLEEKKLLFGSEKLLLIVHAKVLAGVDLSKLTASHVRFGQENQVSVALPAAKILEVVLDEEQTKVWDRKITWWTPWVPFNPDLERQARLSALQAVRDTALQMGILNDASKNAEQSVRSLLLAVGFESVNFEPYDERQ